MIRNENIRRMQVKQENIENNLYQNQLQKDQKFAKKKKEEEEINQKHRENIDWNDYQRDKNNQAIMEKQLKIEKFKDRNALEKKRYMEELQNYYRQKEQEHKEQKEYYENMKINETLNRINEKQKEYETFVKSKMRENEQNRLDK